MNTLSSLHSARPFLATSLVSLGSLALALASSACAVGADPATEAPQAPAQTSSALSAGRESLDPAHVAHAPKVGVEATDAPAIAHDANQAHDALAAHVSKPGAEDTKAIWLPYYRPDLTVVRDNRSVWKWDGYGWYPAYATGFTVSNIGSATSSSFHVMILNGARSRGFDLGPMAPGASQYFELDGELSCGTTATVIVNPNQVGWESNYDNDVATVPGLCNL